jgi:hypothetical protein
MMSQLINGFHLFEEGSHYQFDFDSLEEIETIYAWLNDIGGKRRSALGVERMVAYEPRGKLPNESICPIVRDFFCYELIGSKVSASFHWMRHYNHKFEGSSTNSVRNRQMMLDLQMDNIEFYDAKVLITAKFENTRPEDICHADLGCVHDVVFHDPAIEVLFKLTWHQPSEF